MSSWLERELAALDGNPAGRPMCHVLQSEDVARKRRAVRRDKPTCRVSPLAPSGLDTISHFRVGGKGELVGVVAAHRAGGKIAPTRPAIARLKAGTSSRMRLP